MTKKELQEENERLKVNCNIGNENLTFYRNSYKDYKTIIDKAIEYIKEDMYVEPKELYGLVDGEHLLNILEGEE